MRWFAFEKAHKGWTLEADGALFPSFKMKAARTYLEAAALEQTHFAIVTPPQPVGGCTRLQFTPDGRYGLLHGELSLGEAGGERLYARDGLTAQAAYALVSALADGQAAPTPEGWYPVEPADGEEERAIYLWIAELLTGGADLVKRFAVYYANPGGYYSLHREQFEKRGIFSSDDEDMIRWTALAGALLEGGLARALDPDATLSQFLAAVKPLSAGKGLQAADEWFPPEGIVSAWRRILDERWAERDFVLAGLDTEETHYIVFPVAEDVLQLLRGLAGKIDHRIDRAAILY